IGRGGHGERGRLNQGGQRESKEGDQWASPSGRITMLKTRLLPMYRIRIPALSSCHPDYDGEALDGFAGLGVPVLPAPRDPRKPLDTYMSSKEQHVRSAHNLATVRPQEPDWGALIQRIAHGDRAALADLYDGTAALVHGLTMRILRDRSTAEEATADTFVQAWRQADRWDASRGSPLAWLLMLARSRALDRLRACGPRR